MPTMMIPRSAPRSLRNRRQKSCPGERPMISAGTAGSVSIFFERFLVNVDLGHAPPSLGPRSTAGPPVRPGASPAELYDGYPPSRFGVKPEISSISRGRIRGPRISPSDPCAQARSPNEVDPSAVIGPARDEQGDRVGRVRPPHARGRVVPRDRHDRPRRVDPRQHLPEEGPVDGGDDVPLVLRPAVVGGHVGSLQVDVERLVAVRAPRRPGAPIGRTPPRRPARTPPGSSRGASTVSIPSAIAMPALHRHLDEAPPRHPEPLLDRLAGAGRWSPASRVRIRFAGRSPASRRRAFTCGRVEDRRTTPRRTRS